MESFEVPDITPPTSRLSLDKSCAISKRDINPYVKKARSINEGNFIDLDFSASSKHLSFFLSQYRYFLLDPMAGSGTFCVNLARDYPMLGIVAVEKRFKRAVSLYQKCQKHGLKNIFVIRGTFEKSVLLLRGVKFDVVYLAFPDPWDRKKWEKHRVYKDLTLFYPLLKQKGFLILKTDNFEVISSVFRHYFECFSLIRLHFPYIEPIKKFRTDFEKLFLSKKGNIWCMCLQPNLVCLNSVRSERAELG